VKHIQIIQLNHPRVICWLAEKGEGGERKKRNVYFLREGGGGKKNLFKKGGTRVTS